jgi:hypothetical protein
MVLAASLDLKGQRSLVTVAKGNGFGGVPRRIRGQKRQDHRFKTVSGEKDMNFIYIGTVESKILLLLSSNVLAPLTGEQYTCRVSGAMR